MTKRFSKAYIKAYLSDLRLIDDVLMSTFFDDDRENVQKMIRIILERDDLVVKSVKTQYKIPNLKGRSVLLDIYAEDEDGRKYNIEFQRERYGAFPKRLRYNQSLIDANSLEKGCKVDDLPDIYVIMVMENNIFEKGEAAQRFSRYHVKRVILETGKNFDDGIHFIYVNGKYRGDDPIGHLVNDLLAKTPDEMHDQIMGAKMHQIKEGENISKEQEMMMNAALQELFNRDHANIIEEMSQVKAENSQVKAEMGQVKAEMGQVKAEMGQVKAENSQVKAEMGQVKAENSQVKAEMGQVKAENSQVKAENSQVKAENRKLKEENNQKNVNSVRALMENLGCDMDKAAQLINLSEEDKQIVKKALAATSLP